MFRYIYVHFGYQSLGKSKMTQQEFVCNRQNFPPKTSTRFHLIEKLLTEKQSNNKHAVNAIFRLIAHNLIHKVDDDTRMIIKIPSEAQFWATMPKYRIKKKTIFRFWIIIWEFIFFFSLQNCIGIWNFTTTFNGYSPRYLRVRV